MTAEDQEIPPDPLGAWTEHQVIYRVGDRLFRIGKRVLQASISLDGIRPSGGLREY